VGAVRGAAGSGDRVLQGFCYKKDFC